MAERRSRRGAPAAREPEAHHGRVIWWQLLVSLLVIAAVVAAGLGLGRATETPVPKGLAACSAAARPEVGPHVYAGPPRRCIDPARQYTAILNTTHGLITLNLTPKEAPITVNNFVVLAVNGYYNGLSFWHKKDPFVQGGDPREDGSGGPGYTLPEEPTNTNWPQGSVGMARFPGDGINGSQFFIVNGQWPAPGPAGVVYNRFAGVDGQSQVLAAELTTSDRILSISVAVK